MVINQRIAELIYRSLDGELSHREDAELRRSLAESPEDREYFDQLERLARMAHHVPSVDPPETLKGDILESIDQRRYGTKPMAAKKPNRSTPMTFLFAPRFVYGLAAGLLLGVALGIITQQSLVGSGAVRKSDLTGTLSLGDSANSRRLDTQSFNAEGLRGQVTVDAAGALSIVRVSVTSEHRTSVALAYSSSDLELRALQQNDGGIQEIEQRQDQVTITGVGQRVYLFAFQNISEHKSEISVDIRSAEAASELKFAIPANGH